MSAELDVTRGSAAIFYRKAGGTPWHEQGNAIEHVGSISEALTAAQCDFTCSKAPLYIQTASGDYVEVPDFSAIVRDDAPSNSLGVVGDRYTILQNLDAWRVFEPLLDQGLIELETGGALRGGADVWLLGRFNISHPLVQEVFNGEITPYGLISNNHIGRRKVIVQNTDIRVVCANTIRLALTQAGRQYDAIGITHTATVKTRVVEAARGLWADIVNAKVEAAKQYQLLKNTYLDEELFERLVLRQAVPLPTPNATDKRTQNRTAEAAARRTKLHSLWETGKGHTGDHSAWEALQGLIQAVDHEEEGVFKTRGDRLTSLFDGKLTVLKQSVATTLVNHALAVQA